jgi:hypothetical protein
MSLCRDAAMIMINEPLLAAVPARAPAFSLCVIQ